MTVLQNLQVCAHQKGVEALDILQATGLFEKRGQLAKTSPSTNEDGWSWRGPLQ
jgi:hypothetical protein